MDKAEEKGALAACLYKEKEKTHIPPHIPHTPPALQARINQKAPSRWVEAEEGREGGG